MINNQLFFFKKNLKLFGLEDKFLIVIRLFELEKLPRVLVLSKKRYREINASLSFYELYI